MSVVAPKISRLVVTGIRCLRHVDLRLDGLSVLIGDNGSGKSTIIEAREILRAATHEGFERRLASTHGGIGRLREEGTSESVTISVDIDDGEPVPLAYTVEWPAPYDNYVETLSRGDPRLDPNGISKVGPLVTDPTGSQAKLPPHQSLLHTGTTLNRWVETAATALHGIEVHLPFEVTAHWAGMYGDKPSPRTVSLVEPTTRLDRFGTNLVNAYQALKNDVLG